MLALDQSNLTLRIGSLAAIAIYSAVFLLLLGILLLRFIRLTRTVGGAPSPRPGVPCSPNVVEVPETLPPLTTRDHIVLLYLWNHCYESIRGEARTNLKELAKRTGTDQFAKELLHARLLRRRLLAIVTLGHLQERSIWNDLAAMLQVDNAFVSLVAAKALLQIDAKEAIHSWFPFSAVATTGHPSKWSPCSNRRERTLRPRPSRRPPVRPPRKSGPPDPPSCGDPEPACAATAQSPPEEGNAA